jgi:hypothetical protein
MSCTSSQHALTTWALFGSALLAQEAPANRVAHLDLFNVEILHDQRNTELAKVTLWCHYPSRYGAYRDHSQYLLDLHARLNDQGVVIAIVMPHKDARWVAEKKPRVVVAAPQGTTPQHYDNPNFCIVTIPDHQPRVVPMDNLDLAFDILQELADPDWISLNLEIGANHSDQHWALLASIIDGHSGTTESTNSTIDQLITASPHSGCLLACRVLHSSWGCSDLEAARARIDAAIDVLANHAMPMTTFTDLVLRGSREDPVITRKLAMAMAPVAASAPDGAFTQLVYLRALLRLGQQRIAERIIRNLPKTLEKDARNQIVFAETLMDAPNPITFRQQAEKAVNAAETLGMDRRWLYAARHKILTRCEQSGSAEELAREYRLRIRSDFINNDAWYLMVQPETLGRFDSLALSHCEELMNTVDSLDALNLDTVALAQFLNGQTDKAIKNQTMALATTKGETALKGELARRLAYFKAVKEATTPNHDRK